MSWDGKMYDKYRIAHTDGTPLKGKKYFVLRLDSDNPVEAARVAAAMRAYKSSPRNCDLPEVAKGQPKLAEQAWRVFKRSHKDSHPDSYGLLCCITWLLAPAAEKEGGAK